MNYFEEINADIASSPENDNDYQRLCLALTYLYDLEEEGMNEV